MRGQRIEDTHRREAAAEGGPAGKARPRTKAEAAGASTPSRARLDGAEQAQADHKDWILDLRQRERDLQQERRALGAAHAKGVAKLKAALETRQRYGEAL
jgi:hypothetical protein